MARTLRDQASHPDTGGVSAWLTRRAALAQLALPHSYTPLWTRSMGCGELARPALGAGAPNPWPLVGSGG